LDLDIYLVKIMAEIYVQQKNMYKIFGYGYFSKIFFLGNASKYFFYFIKIIFDISASK